MGRIIKTSWDCEYCGTKDIPGDVRHCPNCGAPVGDGIKYNIPDNKVYVDKSVVPKGPDWQCNNCGSYNRFEANICCNCGGDKKGTRDYFGENVSEKIDTDSCINFPEDNNYPPKSIEEAISQPFENTSQNSYESSSSADLNGFQERTIDRLKRKLISATDFIIRNPIILVIICALALVTGIIALAIPREREITVTEIFWQRNSYIEQYKTVQEDDWTLPSEARVLYTAMEVHHYDRVQVGEREVTYTEREFDHYDYKYKDLGNGYAEEVAVPVYVMVEKTRTEPVYENVPVKQLKYYYEIDKYVYDRTLTTSGFNKEPYWPQNEPTEKKNPQIGDERVSSRKETYSIKGFITDKPEKIKSYDLSYSEWMKLDIGATVKCKVNLLTGHIRLIDSEKDNQTNDEVEN